MKFPLPTRLIGRITACAIIVLAALGAHSAGAQEIRLEPLFAATLANLDDKPVALAQYKGKPLVVNFWARWCAPCRAEIPELIKFRKAHPGELEVLGIGIEDQAEPAREFARTHAMDYPVFVAKEQGIPLMLALGNTKSALPYTLFVDRHGQVVRQKLGRVRAEDLDEVAPLLLKK